MKQNKLIPIISVIAVILMILPGCTSAATPSTTLPATSITTVPTVTATSQTPTGTVTTIPPASTTPVPTLTTTVPPVTIPAHTTIVTPSLTIPEALINSSTVLNNTQYVVFAWNTLGMHCSNPTYDKAVLLPPYNDLWVQVVKRGNPPQIITTGVTVEYSILNNTTSYNKELYGQFWDNAKKLFGVTLARDFGLNLTDPNIHNGMSGSMVAKTDHFEADGIPITPINDDGTWNPYQVGQVVVKDASGKIVARTNATIPISSEINCAKCHGANAFEDVLQQHDRLNGTNLVNSEPVLCAGCHGDPALGAPKSGNKYLSDAVHGFHSTVSPQPSCYDCHPGAVSKCSRSIAHSTADGNCTTCHGTLANVSSSIQNGRIPWANEPACVTCHAGVAEVNTQTTLYRNATGHGGIYCTSCHSSPHAMVPSSITLDNYQALQYQGATKTIGSCGACHSNSRGDNELGEFTEIHGQTNPSVPNSCSVCHTSIPTDTSRWPHSFQWQPTQGTGILRGDD
jgi:hypothetical protein